MSKERLTSSQSEPEFVEYVARLVNVLGTELCKIYTETSLPTEGKAAAWAMIEQMTPYLLKFLANEYDDTSSAVFPFVNDMLYIVSKHTNASFIFTYFMLAQKAKEADASIFSRPTRILGLFT
jgi:hypothetical protein